VACAKTDVLFNIPWKKLLDKMERKKSTFSDTFLQKCNKMGL
jgi:hypothetical protein